MLGEAVGVVPQRKLQVAIAVGGENLPEDGHAFLGGSKQQLEEITLGDHSHLGELLPADAKNVPHGSIHIALFGDDAAIGQGQLRFGALLGGAAATQGRAGIFGIAANGVLFVPGLKNQFHISGRIRCGVFAAEHIRLPGVTAGRAIQGKGDGIEDGGFARAGIAADEIETLVAQLGKLQHGFASIGAEGGHGELQWSHGVTSQMRLISCAI